MSYIIMDPAFLQWWKLRQAAQQQQSMLQSSAAWFLQASVLLMPPSLTMFTEPRISVTRVPRVDLSTWDEADCITTFRFTLPEISHICRLMGFPPVIVVNRVTFTAETAMAIMLRRLAYPTRLADMATLFGLDTSSISRIVNHMLTEIIDRYRDHIHFWPGLTAARIRKYAAVITQHTPAVIDIWGFIDGTFRDIAKPEVDESSSYSGYEREHGQKYQGVLCPDGLVVSMDGPYVGSKNDLNLLAESDIQTKLLPLVTQADGRTLQLYGDKAYKGQSLVMCPYARYSVDQAERAYNKIMSRLRVSVESGFGKVTQYFSATDLRRAMRTGLMPTGSYYLVSTLMTNVHTCMHGSNVPWSLDPPSVEEYLDRG
jgi:nuclease HARBI1